MRIIVDVDKCIGAGQCVRSAASVFAQDDDTGLVVLLDGDPPATMREAVTNAVRVCPVNAIWMEE